MRIPIDYDKMTVPEVRREALRLFRPEILRAEIWQTSPGNLRLVFVALMSLDEALDLIDQAKCDEDYKYWVRHRHDITERLTGKSTGATPTFLESVDLTPATWPSTFHTW